MPENKPEAEVCKILYDFCQRYGAINVIAQQTQRVVDRYAATQFSIFKWLGNNEMTLSDIIADLLSLSQA